jgi:hypothetical protein
MAKQWRGRLYRRDDSAIQFAGTIDSVRRDYEEAAPATWNRAYHCVQHPESVPLENSSRILRSWADHTQWPGQPALRAADSIDEFSLLSRE